MAVKVPPRIAISDLMKRAKGVSSAFANDEADHLSLFRWQEGYGVFSVSRSHLSRVIAYIEKQKRHHEAGRIWPEWEETGDRL